MSDSFFVLNDVLQCGVPLHCFDNLIGSKIGLFIILRSQQVFSPVRHQQRTSKYLRLLQTELCISRFRLF